MDPDRRWQIGIGTHYPGFEATTCGVVKMNHLPDAMHAGIGSSGTVATDRRVSDLRQGLLQGFLYCVYG